MSKVPIVSILNQITELAFNIKKNSEVVEVKQKIIVLITESKVKETDKKLMIKTITEFHTVLPLQRYVCNALLKYEGLGMAQLDKALNKGKKDEETSYEMNTDVDTNN